MVWWVGEPGGTVCPEQGPEVGGPLSVLVDPEFSPGGLKMLCPPPPRISALAQGHIPPSASFWTLSEGTVSKSGLTRAFLSLRQCVAARPVGGPDELSPTFAFCFLEPSRIL